MRVIYEVDTMREALRHQRPGSAIGLVPTMGALHRGHLSLVESCLAECDVSIVSIFVNPTQFAPHEDFDAYPRNLESDLEKLRPLGVDFVFAVHRDEMYPSDFSTYVNEEELSSGLCGASRKGHFKGVTTVCLKLFLMTMAKRAYFGQKDYQQTAVLRRMIRDLNVDIDLIVCPTVRDEDGLALSSRNSYLSPAERVRAVSLYRALTLAKEALTLGQTECASLIEIMKSEVESREGTIEMSALESSLESCAVEYIAVVSQENLQPLKTVDRPAVAALAVRVGRTRLIDNMLLTPVEGR